MLCSESLRLCLPAATRLTALNLSLINLPPENIFWLIRSDPAKGLVLILFNLPYSSVFSL